MGIGLRLAGLYGTAAAGLAAFSWPVHDPLSDAEVRRGRTVNLAARPSLWAWLAAPRGSVLSDGERRCLEAAVALVSLNPAPAVGALHPAVEAQGTLCTLRGAGEVARAVRRLGAVLSVEAAAPVVVRGQDGEFHLELESRVAVPLPWGGEAALPAPFRSRLRVVLADQGAGGGRVISATEHRWFAGRIAGTPSFDGGAWSTRLCDAARRLNGFLLGAEVSAAAMERWALRWAESASESAAGLVVVAQHTAATLSAPPAQAS